jgi:hypothetical protein
VTTIVCQQAVGCGRFPDQQTCVVTLALDYGSLETDSDAGRVQYYPQLAGDCVDQIHNGKGLGSCSLTVALSSADLPDCRDAVVGLVQPKIPCIASDDCGGASATSARAAPTAGAARGRAWRPSP